MKKLFAAVLALMLAMTCVFAMAEGTVVQKTLDYDITIDVPDGYTMEKITTDEGIMAEFKPADPAAAEYILGILYSEMFGDYTLNDLSEEETAEMTELLTGDFADAVITYPTTQVGTKLIQVDEKGSESAYGFVLTIYHGYFVQISVTRPDGAELTEADYQVAVDLMSSLQMVKLAE